MVVVGGSLEGTGVEGKGGGRETVGLRTGSDKDQGRGRMTSKGKGAALKDKKES